MSNDILIALIAGSASVTAATTAAFVSYRGSRSNTSQHGDVLHHILTLGEIVNGVRDDVSELKGDVLALQMQLRSHDATLRGFNAPGRKERKV